MKRLTILFACALVALPALAASEAEPLRRVELAEKIVNGLVTSDFPSAVAILDADSGVQICSGTLVGCSTVLTAAHCVCDGAGGDCQGSSGDLRRPSDLRIFSQHLGFLTASRVVVPAAYEFGVGSDVAVIRLSAPIEGVAPAPINEQVAPSPGSVGTIVGFGLTRGDLDDAGLKRQGRVETTPCTQVPAAPHLCWQFTSPLGAAGGNSNTCVGDSGGPLYLDLGAGPVVAGVTSGGMSDDCLPLDESWDANVFFDRVWIRGEAGDDLDARACGALPAAGGAGAPVYAATAQLGAATPRRLYSVDVPPGATTLRVTLNAVEGPVGVNDFDLFLRAAIPPTATEFDCSSQLAGSYEVCDVAAPAPGAWYVLVDRFAGDGRFQATATVFGGDASDTEGCVPSATTLCIDDEPGDRRFAITVDYETSMNGGTTGDGKGIPLSSLGIRRGGLFWFFDVTNPELLIKVLNGCALNGKFWVFWSAGTTVGLDLRVTDTKAGATVAYGSPDGTPAAPVTDTEAFECEVITSAGGIPVR